MITRNPLFYCMVVFFSLIMCESEVSAHRAENVGYALENGDSDGDGRRSLLDGIYLLRSLFRGGPAPVPLALCGGVEPAVENGDWNGDGSIDLGDVFRLLRWLFKDRPTPAAACGDLGGGDDDVRVIPPEATPYGKSYSEWLAEFWRWAAPLPAAGHPVFDLTGENCGVGQSGPVWFLGPAGTLPPGTITRNCAIPAGTAIAIPVIAGECSSIPEDSDFGANEEELRACTEARLAFIRQCFEFEVEIDGVPIGDLGRFLTSSPLFDLGPFPADGIFGFPEGSEGQSIGRALMLMLAPPSVGDHVIRFKASISPSCVPPAPSFELIYNLTVEP